MKIRIIAVGKAKERAIQQIIVEYLKRMHDKIEIIEVKDSDKEKEGKRIIELCENYDILAMDEKGKEYDSVEFSEKIGNVENKTAFVIGGPNGLSDEVKQKAKEMIALSQMTLTHEMARLFLVEQIYRGFEIIKGTKYHK